MLSSAQEREKRGEGGRGGRGGGGGERESDSNPLPSLAVPASFRPGCTVSRGCTTEHPANLIC